MGLVGTGVSEHWPSNGHGPNKLYFGATPKTKYITDQPIYI